MRLLVVGCGAIGARHASNALPMAEVAVVDTAAERLRIVGNDLGVIGFASIEQGIDWLPTAAIVATPHTTHVALAQKLVAAGVPVLIEKPIADRLDGVVELLGSAEATGTPVYVVCNMRFHPGVAEIRRHLAEIGKPYFARAHYGNYLPDMRPRADYRELYCARKERGGGVVLDAIHEIDYLTWLLGDVAEVNAVTATLGDLDIDVEDYAAISLRHAGRARSEIHLDYLQRCKRRGCEVVGPEGTLVWSSSGKNPEGCAVTLYTSGSSRWHTLYQSERIDTNRPYVELMQAFLASAQGTADPVLLTGTQAARTLEIALLALAAAVDGQRRQVRSMQRPDDVRPSQ